MTPVEPKCEGRRSRTVSRSCVKEYGTLALVVYFALFLLCLAGFTIAIEAGLSEPLARRFGVSPKELGAGRGRSSRRGPRPRSSRCRASSRRSALTPLVGRIPPIHRLLDRLGEKQR